MGNEKSFYSEALKNMVSKENRSLLRPTRATYRNLACQMLEISTMGGMPTFLSNYFGQLVAKQSVVICSQVLLEVRKGLKSIEIISSHLNKFFEVFADCCSNLKRIIQNRLNESDLTRTLARITMGDSDEVYRLEGLIDSNLASFLINVLRTLYGKVVNGILVYALNSNSSDDIDALLQENLKINEHSSAKPLIEVLITLTDLVFLLGEELNVNESIPIMQNLFRRDKFFIQAGCKGMISIPPAPSVYDSQPRRNKSVLQSSRSRATSPTESEGKSYGKKRQRRMTATKGQRSLSRDYRFMLSHSSGEGQSVSEDSSQQERLKRETEFFSSRRAVMNLDSRESDSESNQEYLMTSVYGHFIDGKYKAVEGEVPTETMALQVKRADGEVAIRKAIEAEQMELVVDSWSTLSELLGMIFLSSFRDFSERSGTFNYFFHTLSRSPRIKRYSSLHFPLFQEFKKSLVQRSG